MDDKTRKITPPKKKKKSNGRVKRFIIIALLVLLGIAIIAGIGIAIYAYQVISTAPAINPEDLKPVQTTFVYDDQGEMYTSFHGEEDRTVIAYDDIPDYLINAFIAIEDERYWTHPGVDLRALARIAYKMATGGRVEGASTITQQLLKNTVLTPAKTIKRKLQEQWLALRLERMYTKEEILEMYLNRVFLGHYAHGVEAASYMYFGCSVTELSLSEAAVLAAVNQSPNYWSPYNNLEGATERRNLVLSMMLQQGYITEEENTQARNEEIVLMGASRQDEQPFPQFTWHMKEVAKEVLVENGVCEDGAEADQLIFGGGLHIYTTLNQKMQAAIELSIQEVLEDVGEEEEDGTMGPQVAAMIIDPSTGQVKAAVGDRDVTQNGLKRYAQSYVPTGSSVKPILDYALAIDQKGYTPGTIIDDAPVSYISGGSVYRPLNYHREFLGLVTLRMALVRSLNIPAVKTYMDIGIDDAIAYAHQLGINSTIYPYPSSALGGSEMNLEEMVRAFGVFANEGTLVSAINDEEEWQSIYITKITDSLGNILYEPHVFSNSVMKESSAFIMTDILTGVVDRYKNARTIERPAAGKTGTSQGSQYTWFIGYTPEYVGGVWIGHDNYKYPPESGSSNQVATSERKWLERTGATGSAWAALTWGNMMNDALAAIEQPVKDFEQPSNITDPIMISTKTGMLPGIYTPTEFITPEIFVKGTEPYLTDNFFFPVQICKDSSKLPLPTCPIESIVERFRFIRTTPYDLVDSDGDALQRPLDSIWEAPTEYCDVHVVVPVDPTIPVDPDEPIDPTIVPPVTPVVPGGN